MADDLSDYAADYYHLRNSDARADALRQRQLQDQQKVMQLQNRRDYVVQPGVVGTRGQALHRVPMQDVQRVPVGEQIVNNPAMLKKAIMPSTPMRAALPPKMMSTKQYAPKIERPLKSVPSMLYMGGIQTGAPVKKWPTSFKKATHKPTPDESIMKGLKNLDRMSDALLGKRRG